MFTIRESLLVHAPAERCFALSTNLAVVSQTLDMRPVAGRTTGCVKGGDTVRWRGWRFGFPQTHLSLITNYQAPYHFQDRMLEGRFKFFAHDHGFRQVEGGVLLEDVLRFTMPFGLAGWLVGRLIMVPTIRRLMQQRFQLLKEVAEGDAWRKYTCDAA